MSQSHLPGRLGTGRQFSNEPSRVNPRIADSCCGVSWPRTAVNEVGEPHLEAAGSDRMQGSTRPNFDGSSSAGRTGGGSPVETSRSSEWSCSATGCVRIPRSVASTSAPNVSLAVRRWAYVQDYADAKSSVVEGIIARARAGSRDDLDLKIISAQRRESPGLAASAPRYEGLAASSVARECGMNSFVAVFIFVGPVDPGNDRPSHCGADGRSVIVVDSL